MRLLIIAMLIASGGSASFAADRTPNIPLVQLEQALAHNVTVVDARRSIDVSIWPYWPGYRCIWARFS